MTTQPPDLPTGTCCGEGGPETPAAGQPRVMACMLCPASASYWRLPENRSDGLPYTPVKPLGEVD